MRITHDMLMKVASDAVARQTRQNRDLLSAYLCGSLLSEDYLLGGTADVDLVFIYNEPQPFEREVRRLTDDVHLDIAHHSQKDYRELRRLRVHPWLGPVLTTCKILYDPQHFLDFTQASVRGQFDRPDHVFDRSSSQAELARRIWWDHQSPIPDPQPEDVGAYLQAVAHAANATNATVRRLTFITTIFMPLSLLAGIGGMSEWTMMTGAENWRIAYPLFLVAMVVIGVANYYLLKLLERRGGLR